MMGMTSLVMVLAAVMPAVTRVATSLAEVTRLVPPASIPTDWRKARMVASSMFWPDPASCRAACTAWARVSSASPTERAAFRASSGAVTCSIRLSTWVDDRPALDAVTDNVPLMEPTAEAAAVSAFDAVVEALLTRDRTSLMASKSARSMLTCAWKNSRSSSLSILSSGG